MTAAQQALEKLPLSDVLSPGVRVWLFESSATYVTGDLAQAYATFYQHGESGPKADSQIGIASMACFIHWSAADLTTMAQLARYAVDNSDMSAPTEAATWSRYHLGLFHYQHNDLIAAEKLLLPLATQPHASSQNCFLNSAVILARIWHSQGRTIEAFEIADLLSSFGLETHDEAMLFNARAFQAELALRHGHLAEASQWVEHHGPFMPSLAANLFFRPRCWHWFC